MPTRLIQNNSTFLTQMKRLYAHLHFIKALRVGARGMGTCEMSPYGKGRGGLEGKENGFRVCGVFLPLQRE